MLMVTVSPNTWKVSVIGIVPPPFGDVATTARRECDALSGAFALGDIIPILTEFVNSGGNA